MFSRQNFISIIAISCFYNSALVRSSPLTKDMKIAFCSFPSFECADNNRNARCIPASQICDGVSQCQNSEDEITCEKDVSQFVISNQLQSSAVEMPTIPEITMKGCAKVCREYRDFDCIAIQHNLQSNECRLLDAKFTRKSNKPSLRGFWATFELQNSSVPNKTTTADIPNPVFDDPNRGAEIRETDDAVILEIDLDAFSGERKKRQSGFSFPDVLGALANIFFGSPFTNQPQGRTLGSSFSSCGVRTVEFDPPRRRGAGRIINGVTPPYGAFPWQAALKKTDRSGSFVHHCGGAIVSDRHILTAAHCLIGFRRDDFQVVVGEYDVKHEDSFENVFEVEEFIIHHNYHQRHKRSDDIALVKIETKDERGFQFNSKIQPICLPSSEAVYEPGRWCTASGWGIQKAGDRSSVAKVLKAISVPILSKEECTRKEVYGSNSATEAITEGMICAGYLEGGIDACGGDSGGPLACNIDGQFQLLGLVSWGDGCARENKPGVYVKVYHYINWIHEWMRKL